ncbi:MAG: hypothetical protein IJN25_04550 [Clostridia bacterium]|nr:hypothetical protein [Clostridia bacterium]
MQESRHKGLSEISDGQALALGVIAGASEAITEKIGMDELMNVKGAKSWKQYIVRNARAEAGEEGISNVANFLGDIIVAGDESEFQKNIEYYVKEKGLKENEAFGKAFGDQLLSMGLDALAGAISGSVISGSLTLVNSAVRTRTNRAEENEMVRGMQQWLAERKTREGEGTQYSITEIRGKNGSYGNGVYLDTNVFDGVKPRDWGKTLNRFVYNNLAGSELTMYDKNGNAESVFLAKANDRVKKDGTNNSHKVIDKLARYKGDNIRALATVHLSEALETSGNERSTNEHSHQWMDENGWIYRTAYFMDKKGAIYEATLNIADGKNRKILYDINKIKKIDDGVVPSTTKGRGSLININPFSNMVTQKKGDVKPFDENNSFAISRMLPRAGESGPILPTAKEEMEARERQRRANEAKTETERTGILYGATEEKIGMAVRISEAINREVVFYENTDPNVKNDDGYYNSRDGKIYINAKSKNAIPRIIAHEITHSVELADSYIDLFRTVIRHIQKSGKSISDMRSEIKSRYEENGVKLSKTAAIDAEIMAEYIAEHLLTDEASITNLAKESPKSARGILHFLDSILAKLGNTNAQERVFVAKARALYAKALGETQSTAETESERMRGERPVGADSIRPDENGAGNGRIVSAPTVSETTGEKHPIIRENVLPTAAERFGNKTVEAQDGRQPATSTTENGGTESRRAEGMAEVEAIVSENLRPEIAENAELMEMLRAQFGADGTAALARQIKAEVERTGTVGRFGVLLSDGGMAVEETLGAGDVSNGGERQFSISKDEGADTLRERGKITVNMDEDARYEVLKDKKVTPQEVGSQGNADIDFEYLENNIKSVVEKGLLKKFQQMGLFKRYKSIAVGDISFDFTGKGFRKSLHSQETAYGGSKADFAKVLLNLENLLDASVLIETHTDKGKGMDKEKRGLEKVYVLFGALSEDGTITPVQFEVEQYKSNENRLYLAVALTKIETGVKGNTASKERKATSLLPVSDISIAEIFTKINPTDKNFLKYIPNQFLGAEQIAAKEKAFAKDKEKYSNKTNQRDDNIQYAITKDPVDTETTTESAETTDTADFWDAWLEKVKEYGAMEKGEKPAASTTENGMAESRGVEGMAEVEAIVSENLRPEIAENAELMEMLRAQFGADGTAALARQIKAEVEKTGSVGRFGVLFSDGGMAVEEALGAGDVSNGGERQFSISKDEETEGIFSAPQEVTEKLSTQVDAWLSGKMGSSDVFDIGQTPMVLQQLGALDLPVSMSQEVMAKITGEKHNISLGEIKRLPQAIADPIMVFQSATVQDALVILTELSDKSGNDVVVAMHLNRRRGFNNINRISSAYGKNNIGNFISQQIEAGNLKYADKKMSQEWLRSRGLQLPKLNTILNSNNSILQKEDIVNKYFIKKSGKYAQNAENKSFSISEKQKDGRQYSIGKEKGVAKKDDTEYNKYNMPNRPLKPGDTFPPFNESHSDANERATRWAHREDIKNGDKVMVTYHGMKYVITKDDNTHLRYTIDRKLTKKGYLSAKQYYGEVEEFDINRDEQQRTKGILSDGKGNREYNSNREGGSRNDTLLSADSGRTGDAEAVPGRTGERTDGTRDTARSIEDQQDRGAVHPVGRGGRRRGAVDDESIQYAITKEPVDTEITTESAETTDTADFWDEWLEKVKEYGAIPKGEKPARDIEVPKKIGKNKPVSQTVRTILEAKVTPDEAIPTIEQMVLDGEFSYDVHTDKKAIKEADGKIEKRGYIAAYDAWAKDMDAGKVSKENTALGWALYNQAATSGDIKTATTILNKMVQHQRNAAQALQATRILKQLSPEGQLYQAVNAVEALQQELKEKYGDKAPDLKIDENLAKEFLEARTQNERDEIIKIIYRDIGRQMPSRFIDKWNAWRYLAMLGNPRTHIRNIVGNAEDNVSNVKIFCRKRKNKRDHLRITCILCIEAHI